MDLLVQPQSNIVCYRFLTENPALANSINQRIREQVLQGGRFYIVQTVIDETYWLRSTLASATTTTGHLCELLDLIEQLGCQLEQSGVG